MENKFQAQLRALRLYNVFLTLLIFSLIFLSFKNDEHKESDEISVKRINILGKDGKLKIVIGGRGMLPHATMNGKEFSKQERGSGIIFYNEDGDECGGSTRKAGACWETLPKKDMPAYP